MILENVKEMWTEVWCLILSTNAFGLTSLGPNDHASQCRHYTTLQLLLSCVSYFTLLQIPKTGKGKKGSTPVNKDRFIPKLFIRGDSVILVLRNPK